jgi:hypothetical protein
MGDGFLLNQAIKGLEAHFITTIMAEKPQKLSQRTSPFEHISGMRIKNLIARERCAICWP